MNMIISGVVDHEGKKRAFVVFEEGNKNAEAMIPDCKVVKNNGFSEEEVGALENYLSENLEMLKRQAAQNNPIRAMMKEKE